MLKDIQREITDLELDNEQKERLKTQAERELIRARQENTALESELQEKIEKLQGIHQQLDDFRLQQREEMALETADEFFFTNRRILKNAYRRFRDGVQVRLRRTHIATQIRGIYARFLLASCWGMWGGFVGRRRFMYSALARRRRETLHLILANWKIHTALEKLFKISRKRVLTRRIFYAWRDTAQEGAYERWARGATSEWRTRRLLRRVFLDWKASICFLSWNSAATIRREALAEVHFLRKLFQAWFVVAVREKQDIMYKSLELIPRIMYLWPTIRDWRMLCQSRWKRRGRLMKRFFRRAGQLVEDREHLTAALRRARLLWCQLRQRSLLRKWSLRTKKNLHFCQLPPFRSRVGFDFPKNSQISPSFVPYYRPAESSTATRAAAAAAEGRSSNDHRGGGRDVAVGYGDADGDQRKTPAIPPFSPLLSPPLLYHPQQLTQHTRNLSRMSALTTDDLLMDDGNTDYHAQNSGFMGAPTRSLVNSDRRSSANRMLATSAVGRGVLSSSSAVSLSVRSRLNKQVFTQVYRRKLRASFLQFTYATSLLRRQRLQLSVGEKHHVIRIARSYFHTWHVHIHLDITVRNRSWRRLKKFTFVGWVNFVLLEKREREVERAVSAMNVRAVQKMIKGVFQAWRNNVTYLRWLRRSEEIVTRKLRREAQRARFIVWRCAWSANFFWRHKEAVIERQRTLAIRELEKQERERKEREKEKNMKEIKDLKEELERAEAELAERETAQREQEQQLAEKEEEKAVALQQLKEAQEELRAAQEERDGLRSLEAMLKQQQEQQSRRQREKKEEAERMLKSIQAESDLLRAEVQAAREQSVFAEQLAERQREREERDYEHAALNAENIEQAVRLKEGEILQLEQEQASVLRELERVRERLGEVGRDGAQLLQENEALIRSRTSRVNVMKTDNGILSAKVRAMQELIEERKRELQALHSQRVLSAESREMAELRAIHSLESSLHDRETNPYRHTQNNSSRNNDDSNKNDSSMDRTRPSLSSPLSAYAPVSATHSPASQLQQKQQLQQQQRTEPRQSFVTQSVTDVCEGGSEAVERRPGNEMWFSNLPLLHGDLPTGFSMTKINPPLGMSEVHQQQHDVVALIRPGSSGSSHSSSDAGSSPSASSSSNKNHSKNNNNSSGSGSDNSDEKIVTKGVRGREIATNLSVTSNSTNRLLSAFHSSSGSISNNNSNNNNNNNNTDSGDSMESHLSWQDSPNSNGLQPSGVAFDKESGYSFTHTNAPQPQLSVSPSAVLLPHMHPPTYSSPPPLSPFLYYQQQQKQQKQQQQYKQQLPLLPPPPPVDGLTITRRPASALSIDSADPISGLLLEQSNASDATVSSLGEDECLSHTDALSPTHTRAIHTHAQANDRRSRMPAAALSASDTQQIDPRVGGIDTSTYISVRESVNNVSRAAERWVGKEPRLSILEPRAPTPCDVGYDADRDLPPRATLPLSSSPSPPYNIAPTDTHTLSRLSAHPQQADVHANNARTMSAITPSLKRGTSKTRTAHSVHIGGSGGGSGAAVQRGLSAEKGYRGAEKESREKGVFEEERAGEGGGTRWRLFSADSRSQQSISAQIFPSDPHSCTTTTENNNNSNNSNKTKSSSKNNNSNLWNTQQSGNGPNIHLRIGGLAFSPSRGASKGESLESSDVDGGESPGVGAGWEDGAFTPTGLSSQASSVQGAPVYPESPKFNAAGTVVGTDPRRFTNRSALLRGEGGFGKKDEAGEPAGIAAVNVSYPSQLPISLTFLQKNNNKNNNNSSSSSSSSGINNNIIISSSSSSSSSNSRTALSLHRSVDSKKDCVVEGTEERKSNQHELRQQQQQQHQQETTEMPLRWSSTSTSAMTTSTSLEGQQFLRPERAEGDYSVVGIRVSSTDPSPVTDLGHTGSGAGSGAADAVGDATSDIKSSKSRSGDESGSLGSPAAGASTRAAERMSTGSAVASPFGGVVRSPPTPTFLTTPLESSSESCNSSSSSSSSAHTHSVSHAVSINSTSSNQNNNNKNNKSERPN